MSLGVFADAQLLADCLYAKSNYPLGWREVFVLVGRYLSPEDEIITEDGSLTEDYQGRIASSLKDDVKLKDCFDRIADEIEREAAGMDDPTQLRSQVRAILFINERIKSTGRLANNVHSDRC